jgi:hypothetical protein
MTATQPGSDGDELGPVDFLAIEFPGGRLTAAGFEQLLSLADQGIVDILDMEFITKDASGKSKKVDVWEFAVPEGVDLSAWAGASSGLLDDSDVGEISLGAAAGQCRRCGDLREPVGSRPGGRLAARRRPADRQWRIVRRRHRRCP